MPVYRLPESLVFPPPHKAIEEGLLAVGGDLRMERLLLAYTLGIFPWYSEGDPILWWSPDPRTVLYPDRFHVARSLRKLLRQERFRITSDVDFGSVIRACAETRGPNREGTWILPEMEAAYCRLHEAGFAHSIEAWEGGRLVGGLYGVSLGGAFFGESMFRRVSNASKAAFAVLVAHLRRSGFAFVDCQVRSEHLGRLGAIEVPRALFLRQLGEALRQPTLAGRWRFRKGRIVVEGKEAEAWRRTGPEETGMSPPRAGERLRPALSGRTVRTPPERN